MLIWQPKRRFTLPAAISPWIILTAFALLLNAPFLPFYEFTFSRLSMPVEIIPGAPEKIRLFWQAYFWILVSTILAFPFLKVNKAILKESLSKWLKRAPRPMLSSAVFFAIAFLINHSGKNADWDLVDPANNMVYVIADAASSLFGRFYPAVAPFLGLLSGFISGSETSAIAMLTGIHLSTAEKIGAAGFTGSCRQRYRGWIGQRDLSRKTSECRRQHRPHRRRKPGHPGDCSDLLGDNSRSGRDDYFVGY